MDAEGFQRKMSGLTADGCAEEALAPLLVGGPDLDDRRRVRRRYCWPQPQSVWSGHACRRCALFALFDGEIRGTISARKREPLNTPYGRPPAAAMRLAIGRDVGAQPMRCLGLADAGDIVVLALDCEQRNAVDLGGSTRTPRSCAFGQVVPDERFPPFANRIRRQDP
jgi:hypothetical protein